MILFIPRTFLLVSISPFRYLSDLCNSNYLTFLTSTSVFLSFRPVIPQFLSSIPILQLNPWWTEVVPTVYFETLTYTKGFLSQLFLVFSQFLLGTYFGFKYSTSFPPCFPHYWSYRPSVVLLSRPLLSRFLSSHFTILHPS